MDSSLQFQVCECVSHKLASMINIYLFLYAEILHGMCRSLYKQKGQQIIVNITVEYNVNYAKHAVLYVHFCAVVYYILDNY